MYREALAIFKDLPDKKERDLLVAAQLDRLGTALRQQGKLAEAEPLILQALAMRREVLGTNALPVARSLNNCALLLKEESKLGEAEAMLRESLEILAILARNHKPVEVDVLFTRYNLGVTLEHEGKLGEAEDLYRLCLEVAKRWVGDRPEALLEHANNISVYFYGLRAVLIKQGKLKQAEASQREALASLRNLADSLMLRNERENPDLLRSRGRVLARLGRWREAASDLTRARELSSAGQLVVWHELAALLVQE